MKFDAGPIDTHTPGPWKILTRADGISGTVVVGGAPELNELPVAEIWHTCLKNEVANSRLVASAPELKQRLEDLITVVEMTDVGNSLHTEIMLAWNLIQYIDTGVDYVSDCINGPALPPSASESEAQ